MNFELLEDMVLDKNSSDVVEMYETISIIVWTTSVA